MKSKTVIRRTRLAIFTVCLLLATLTFFRLKAVSDPLSRYPYGTPEQREMLSMLLDDEEISTLINMQLQPEEVIPFAQAEEFTMNNIAAYNMAWSTQNADPQFVVYFVNQYKDRLSNENMQEILSWMSYTDLIDYFESANSTPLKTSSPEQLNTILDGTQSIGRWRPSDLKEIAEGIYLRFEAAQAWEKMASAAAGAGSPLTAISGYMSLEQQQDAPEYSSYPQGPYGTREEQLGLTVHLAGFDEWNAACSSQPEETRDLSSCLPLDEAQTHVLQWLDQNAWKYGWILRYPADKQSVTHQGYQPFVLRYVGLQNAKPIHDQRIALEELK